MQNIKIIKTYGFPFLLSLLILSVIFIFVQHDPPLYHQTIARVASVHEISRTSVRDDLGNKDKEIHQKIVAVLLNGKYSGEKFQAINEYMPSQAYSQKYTKGTELFVQPNRRISRTWTGTVIGVKRDRILLPVLAIFFILLLLIGKKQGFLSLFSLLFNVACLTAALDFYLKHRNFNLLLVFLAVVFVCTIVSLILVSGFHKKTLVAALATLITTYLTLLVAWLVIYWTSGNGVRYESMEFVTIPPQNVFLSEILIGSLGAIMDTAITISSSMEEIYKNNPAISIRRLSRAGFGIGRDIMGVMTNILLFAYISGSIPAVILYLMNGYPLNYAFSLNLSLQIIRFLVGGIGIVLAIPTAIYLSLGTVFSERRRAA